jgi:hypothetical protein
MCEGGLATVFDVICALLPDGRFSGQITQNRPEKNISGRKKLVAVRPPIFLKNG